ncbi:CBS domain [Sesbania bispinosa]|nr:CBS domain [Sesbania bispinosa]
MLSKCDTYFETIQSRKKLPQSLQDTLTDAFTKIPVSSFPGVPGGKVIEILADTPIGEAVRILSESNILAAPVKDPDAGPGSDWRDRYLGIIDYSAIILWVMESAELAAVALSAGTATAAGVGAGTVVGAAVAGGVAADKTMAKDASQVADNLGEDFYKLILQEEPFKSTTVSMIMVEGGFGVNCKSLSFMMMLAFCVVVRTILKSYRWAPFVPVARNSAMLTVLLLLSKYRLRNVPVIEPARPISDLGLPFMSPDKVISIQSNELILEAFKQMRDNQIGGLPVVEGPTKKIVGNLSIRDIRHLLLRPELFTNFRKLTVMDFMKIITSVPQDEGKVTQPITCKPNSRLQSVIHTLASQSIHRIYVVDGQDEVVGVITLRDVISCFITEPTYHFDDYYGFAVKEMLNQ